MNLATKEELEAIEKRHKTRKEAKLQRLREKNPDLRPKIVCKICFRIANKTSYYQTRCRKCKGKQFSIYQEIYKIRERKAQARRSNFKQKIRKRKLIIRLGNKCQKCGEENHFVLLIHHKDGDSKNNSDKNRIILCQNCHVLEHITFNKHNSWSPELIKWVEENTGSKPYREWICD